MKSAIERTALTRRWVHAHEEDSSDTLVFRPDSYKFPPSRGRRSFDLQADGALIDHRIGPDDRPRQEAGSWRLTDTNDLEFLPSEPGKRSTLMQVLEVSPDKLVIQRQRP
jgi:hypothetical protein